MAYVAQLFIIIVVPLLLRNYWSINDRFNLWGFWYILHTLLYSIFINALSFYISFALRFSVLNYLFLVFGFEFHILLILGELSLHIESDFHDLLGDEALHKITLLGLLLELNEGTIYFLRLSCPDIVEYFILVDWVVNMEFLHL